MVKTTTVVRKQAPKLVKAKDAKQGTVGYLRDTEHPLYEGILVLRSYDRVISLEKFAGYVNAESFGTSWGNPLPDFDIEVLEEGSVITITL